LDEIRYERDERFEEIGFEFMAVAVFGEAQLLDKLALVGSIREGAEEEVAARHSGKGDFAMEVFLEKGEEIFRKGSGGGRVDVGVFKDVIEELGGEGREVVELRGRLLRRIGNLARRDHRESESAYSIRF